METLRRLRFVWALLCLAAAALCAVALFGAFSRPGIDPSYMFAWLVAALCGAFALYQQTLMRKLSMLWLGGVGGIVLGAFLTQTDPERAVLRTLVFVGGAWVVAAVVVWIAKPAVKAAATRFNP